MPGIITPAGPPPPPILISAPNPNTSRPKNLEIIAHRQTLETKSSRIPKPRNHTSYKKQNSPPMGESALDNPDLGPFLVKLARNIIASGESPVKALEYAIRASKSFERFEEMKLDLAMSLHVTAAIYCSLGKYEEAVPVLERAVAVPEMERGAGRYVFDDWESGSEY